MKKLNMKNCFFLLLFLSVASPLHSAMVSVKECVSYTEETSSLCGPEKQTYLVQAAMGRLIMDLVPLPDKHFATRETQENFMGINQGLNSTNSTYTDSGFFAGGYRDNIHYFFSEKWNFLSMQFARFYQSASSVKNYVQTHDYNESARFVYSFMGQKIEDFSLLIYNAMESGATFIKNVPFYVWQSNFLPEVMIDTVEKQTDKKRLLPIMLSLADQWYLQDQMTLESGIYHFMETYVRVSGRPATLSSFEEALFFALLSAATDYPVLLFSKKKEGSVDVLYIQSDSKAMTLKLLETKVPFELVNEKVDDLRFAIQSRQWGLVDEKAARNFTLPGANPEDFHKLSDVKRTFKYPFKSEKAKCRDDFCKKITVALKVLQEKESEEYKHTIQQELDRLSLIGDFSENEDEREVQALLVLQLGSSPTSEEVKTAYRYFSTLLHPDKAKLNGLSPTMIEASRRAQGLVNEAYKTARKMLKENDS